jgi:rSAM/selenodomain-associated transferase 2
MRAPLSIIIPTYNAAPQLAAMFGCLFEGLEAGLIREVILSDGGSGDDIETLAAEVGASFITGPKGRGGQMARGAGAGAGDWLLFLHADTHLQPGWAASVLQHLQSRSEKAGFFRLAFRAPGSAPRLVAGWANLRAGLFGLPYGDQGLLISKDMLARVGGYPDLPLMEDVALARHLRGRMVALDAVAATSAERYLDEGWVRRGARNLWTLMRYFAGVSPARLARDYGRK